MGTVTPPAVASAPIVAKEELPTGSQERDGITNVDSQSNSPTEASPDIVGEPTPTSHIPDQDFKYRFIVVI